LSRGRPPLPVGTYGRIQVYRLSWGGFRARVRYRDYDGVTRHIERVGPSRTGAENNLKQALRDRARVSTDGEITAQTKVSRLAELWLRDIDESDRAIRTKLTIGTCGTVVLPHRSASYGPEISVCPVWTE
jgi:hypothetical protein